MSLNLETLDLTNKFVSLGSKIQNTREYFQANLTNDEGFYKWSVFYEKNEMNTYYYHMLNKK